MDLKLWGKCALIRAIKTFAQVMATLIGTDLVGFMQIDWLQIVSVSGVAAVLSILTSVAGLPEVKQKQED